jgi:DNA-binding NarL/FixJ family response regulator
VPHPIRLILVDDHAVLRAGLANLLNFESDLTIVAEAGDGNSALKLWRKHRPDIMLLDLSLNGMGGIETLRLLRTEFPEARVLMLTSSETQEDVRQSMKAGACGYITKTVLRGELVESIRAVHAGGQAFGQHLVRLLSADNQRSCLSPRELEVLGLVRQGFTNSDIGRVLTISDHTAKAHVASLLSKLEAADRAEAVARGFELGLLKV